MSNNKPGRERLTFEGVANLAHAMGKLGQGRDVDDVLEALSMLLSFVIVSSADGLADRRKLLEVFANYVAEHIGPDSEHETLQ